MIREASRKGGDAHVGLVVPGSGWPTDTLGEAIAEAAREQGAKGVDVDVAYMTEDEAATLAGSLRKENPRPGDAESKTQVLSIASGKGGVGKSTVTTNLALALAAAGLDVAVVDADVWGYSIPRMLGITRPPLAVESLIVPAAAHGVRAISMDFFVPPDEAVVWRGPMLHKALDQFLGDVFWDEPDFLLIDMPPGTGDVAISISQFVPRARTVVVTTPQPTAQRVAKRAAGMAAKVRQEVVGVIENMAWFVGDDGKHYEIFGSGGGSALAEELGVPLLGQIPLLPEMRDGADRGQPVAVAAPESDAAQAFATIAEAIVSIRPRVRTNPQLVIK
jgi:ATP-binding protein involved in chromosome partitioning